MKLSSKEIFTFLGCALSIFLVAFIFIKLSIPSKIKEKVNEIKTNEQEKTEEEKREELDKKEQEELHIPVYLSSDEALKIGKDLYGKASIISFDPLMYPEFVFKKSDLNGYDTKIVNYSSIVSNIFYNINDTLTSDYYFDGNSLYLNNFIKVKDFTFVKTDLLLTNIEENKITFNARSSYCERNNDKCSEKEIYMYSTYEDRVFTIEKFNDNWLVTHYEKEY